MIALPLAMSSAGWAVIGAVGGALVGSVAGVTGEAWLRSRGERHRAKVGARLLRTDLEFAMATISGVIEDPNHGWFDYMEFNLVAWDEYRDALAARLGPADFEKVTQGVVATREIFVKIPAAPAFPDSGWAPLPDASVEGLRGIRREALGARDALADLGGFKREE